MDVWRRLVREARQGELVWLGRGLTVLRGRRLLIAPALDDPRFGGVFQFIQQFEGYIWPGVVAAFVFAFVLPRAPGRRHRRARRRRPLLYALFQFLTRQGLFGKVAGTPLFPMHFLEVLCVFLILAATIAAMTAAALPARAGCRAHRPRPAHRPAVKVAGTPRDPRRGRILRPVLVDPPHRIIGSGPVFRLQDLPGWLLPGTAPDPTLEKMPNHGFDRRRRRNGQAVHLRFAPVRGLRGRFRSGLVSSPVHLPDESAIHRNSFNIRAIHAIRGFHSRIQANTRKRRSQSRFHSLPPDSRLPTPTPDSDFFPLTPNSRSNS